MKFWRFRRSDYRLQLLRGLSLACTRTVYSLRHFRYELLTKISLNWSFWNCSRILRNHDSVCPNITKRLRGTFIWNIVLPPDWEALPVVVLAVVVVAVVVVFCTHCVVVVFCTHCVVVEVVVRLVVPSVWGWEAAVGEPGPAVNEGGCVAGVWLGGWVAGVWFGGWVGAWRPWKSRSCENGHVRVHDFSQLATTIIETVRNGENTGLFAYLDIVGAVLLLLVVRPTAVAGPRQAAFVAATGSEAGPIPLAAVPNPLETVLWCSKRHRQTLLQPYLLWHKCPWLLGPSWGDHSGIGVEGSSFSKRHICQTYFKKASCWINYG